MKKIVAFGDSFINYDWVDVGHNWVDYLGKHLNIPVVNYGIAASGLGYAMDSFVKYYQSSEYSSDDIIIFVATSEQRLYTSNMYNPRLGAIGIHDNDMHNNTRSEIEKDWIKENKKFALWAIMNIYAPAINYELIKTLSFFKIWAESHLTNSVIILRAFSQLLGNEHAEKLINMISPSKNFFPIINPNTSLGKIAMEEYSSNKLYAQHHEFLNGVDHRINHLSVQNRQNLALMVSKLILTHDINCVDFSWVQKNIITSTSQFESIPKDHH